MRHNKNPCWHRPDLSQNTVNSEKNAGERTEHRGTRQEKLAAGKTDEGKANQTAITAERIMAKTEWGETNSTAQNQNNLSIKTE
jgi:hypothetical protein